MGKQTPAPPPAPDPVAMSQAQSGSNIETAKATAALNRVNTYTPYGSLTYSQNGGGGSSGGGYGGGYPSSGYGGSGGGSSSGGFNAESAFLNPGGAGAQMFGLPDPFKGFTDSITGAGNSTALQDIRRAQGEGLPITDAQWAQAGLPPGGGQMNGGSGGGGGSDGIPQYSANVSFSPTQQALYDAQTGLQRSALDTGGRALQNVNNTISQPFSLDGITPLQNGINTSNIPQLSGIDTSNVPRLPGINDFSANAKATQDAYYSRFAQDFPKTQEDVISRLNAEGIQRGSAGYGNAMDTLGRQETDARNQATLAGSIEQSRLFGLASQANQQQFGQNQAQAAFQNQANQQQFSQNQAQAAFQNQAHQQGVSERLLQRNQPISEFATLLGLGGSNPQLPNVPNFGMSIPPTDLMGAYGLQQQGLQNNYNQQVAQNNSTTGAAQGLGSAALMALMLSDRRFKTVIRRAGRTPNGIPLYLYTFKGSDKPMIGVMAQEVRQIDPFAVHDIGGTLHVDYARVA